MATRLIKNLQLGGTVSTDFWRVVGGICQVCAAVATSNQWTKDMRLTQEWLFDLLRLGLQYEMKNTHSYGP